MRVLILGVMALGLSGIAFGDVFKLDGGSYSFGQNSFTFNVDKAIVAENVDIYLDLETNPFGSIEDLDVVLTSPAGTKVRLVASGVLGDLDGFLQGARFQDTRFTTEAPAQIEAGSPPYTADYKVDGASTTNSMAMFKGEMATGIWTLTVRDTIGLGGTVYGGANLGSAPWTSEGTRLVITIIPPPSLPDMTSASDSGISNADNLTNVKTPTFVGTAKTNLTLVLYNDGIPAVTTTSDSQGLWSATISAPLTEGAHTITARAKDTFGNQSDPSKPLEIVIDSVVPSVSSINNPFIDEDGKTGPLGFVVNDTQTPAAALEVAATSANLTLLPSVGIVLGGSGGSRTIAITPAPDQNGRSSITVTAIDQAGNIGVMTFPVTVFAENDEPHMESIGNFSVLEGSELRFAVIANDIDGDALAYSLEGAPAGAQVNPSTGTFSWTPSEAQGPGVYSMLVRATDPYGWSSARPFTVTVKESNQAPVLAAIPNQVVDEGKSLAFKAQVADADLPANTLVFSLGPNAPQNAVIDPTTGEFHWSPGEGQGPGTYLFTVKVADNGDPSLSASRTFSVTVNEANDAPTLSPIADFTVDEETLLTFRAMVSDSDAPSNTMTFSLGPGAPSGAVINSRTGEFLWAPSEGQGPGVYNITVRVTDNGTPILSAERTFKVTVNEVNKAPILAPIANQTIDERTSLTIHLTAEDADLPANKLTLSLGSGAPPGASIDPVSQVFRWSPGAVVRDTTNVVTIILTDNAKPSRSDSKSFNVVVRGINDPPVIQAPATQTGLQGTETKLSGLVVTDPDAGAELLLAQLNVNHGSLKLPAGSIVNFVQGSNGAAGLVFTGNLTNLNSALAGLSYTGQKDFTGSDLLQVRVSDQGNSGSGGAKEASVSIPIEVRPAESGPTISSLADQVIGDGDATAALLFSVRNEDGSGSTLTVSAQSSNLILVPNEGIKLSGFGADRTVQIEPVAGQLGQAEIRLTVQNEKGAQATTSFRVSVSPASPKILSAVQTRAVLVGSAVNFDAQISGTPPLSFQWLFNGAAISGATNAGFNLTSAQLKDAGTYRLRVKNAATTVEQDIWTLEVRADLGIATDLIDQTAAAGARVEWFIVAAGRPPFQYQWRFNGAILQGATNAQLVLDKVLPSQAGFYSVDVENVSGLASSRLARLQVQGTPSITQQPAGRQVAAGESLTIAVVAAGSGPLSYQWRFNGQILPGAEQAALRLDPADSLQAGTYQVTVKNSVGEVTSRGAVVSVLQPFLISPDLDDRRVLEGETVTWRIDAAASAGRLYQWYFNDAPLVSETRPTLTLTNVTASRSGSYWVEASSAFDRVRSRSASLNVLVPITIQEEPKDQLASAGDRAVFSVLASGTEPLNYQWQLNGADLPQATGPIFTLEAVRKDQEGAYAVLVRNAAGVVSSRSAVLTVSEPIQAQAGVKNVVAVRGDKVILDARSSGSGPFTYEWYFNGVLAPGVTDGFLTVSSAEIGDAGHYSAVIRNASGLAAMSEFRLAVIEAPRIVRQPAQKTIKLGEQATFSVMVEGTGPFHYVWQKDGVTFRETDTPELTVTSDQAGLYRVIVHNKAGSTVTSDSAVLLTLVPPSVKPLPAEIKVARGENVTLQAESQAPGVVAFQWLRNGANIPGANAGVYNLRNIQPSDGGVYAVVVSNAGGVATSSPSSVVVVTPAYSFKDTVSAAIETQTFQGEFSSAAPVSAGHLLWLAWKAPANGVATFDTIGSALDTLLTVYAGPKENLVKMASDDDSGGFQTSAVSFNAAKDQTYYISVEALSGGSGQILMRWKLAETTVLMPVIVRQPASAIVLEGGSANFSIEVQNTDGGTLLYQWYHDGTPVSVGISPVLAISGVSALDAGTYWATVSRSGSLSAESSRVTLQIDRTGAPQAGPGLATSDKFGRIGQTIGLSAPGSAESGGDQARFELKSLPSGRLLSLSNGYTGHTVLSTKLATKDADEPNHARQPGGASVWWTYQAPASGVLRISTEGSDFDTVLAVYTGSSPAYADLTEVVSDDNSGADGVSSVVRFSVEKAKTYYVAVDGVNGAKGLLEFNYELAGAPLPAVGPAWSIFDTAIGRAAGGATNPPVRAGQSIQFGIEAANPLAPATLSFQWRRDGLDLPNATNQILIVTNLAPKDEGAYSVEVSNFAGRAISGSTPLSLKEPVRFAVGLEDRSVIVGQPVTLSVLATGSGPISYRWARNGAALEGQTNASLALSAAQSGLYTVFGRNDLGEASTQATLTVLEPPVLLLQSSPPSVTVGDRVVLSVSVKGSEPIAYQWRFNGVDISGATSNSLTLDHIQSAQAGSYTAIASNEAGWLRCGPIGVTVLDPARFVRQPVGQTIRLGGNAFFDVVAAGDQPLNYQWLFNHQPLAGASGPLLSLSKIRADQAGTYQAVVSGPNGAQILSQEAMLVVAVPPEITVQPQGQIVTAGSNLVLRVEATGGDLRYQWRRDDADLPGKTNAVFQQQTVAAADGGRYSVVVYNDLGVVASSPADVFVQEPVTNLVRIASIHSLIDRSIQLSIEGAAGQSGYLQSSANLEQWNVLASFTLGVGNYEYTDVSATNLTRRFYRIAPAPLRVSRFVRPTEDSVEFEIEHQEKLAVLVRVSVDLLNWKDLGTALVRDGKIELTDSEAAASSRRFYLVIPAP